MKNKLKQTLTELTALDGAPGFEQPVVQYLADKFKAAGAMVTVDTMGNLYASMGDKNAGPHLLLAAHSDEIGAVVRHVDVDGFLRIDPLGGFLPAHLLAQRVRVGSHLGVVGIRPGHLHTGNDASPIPPFSELFIDVGARSSQEVAEMGIQIGSPVTYAASLATFGNADRVTGKAIDNRLGCAVLLHLFDSLSSSDFPGQVTGLVAVQEEVGFRGATVAAYRAQADYAVVVDTFPVGDTPGIVAGRMPGALGKGPVLVIAASSAKSGRGHIAHPRVQAWLEAAANRAAVSIQRATSVGIAISDAAAVHLSREGVPTGVLGLPRRYSHSPVCTFDLNDGVMAIDLLRQFVSDMPNHDNFNFI